MDLDNQVRLLCKRKYQRVRIWGIIVIESSSGDIVALEIKSGSTLKTNHFKGLIALAKTMKKKDFKGIVLYGGDQILPYKVDEHQFWAIPLRIFL